MKKLLQISAFTAILLFASILSYAQEMEDIVYLKNGSVIRGTIIEQVLNESIKIKTRDENVFVYKYDEILKIAKEESSYSGSKSNTVYIGTFGFGLSLPVTDSDFPDSYKSGFNINVSNGILLSENIGIRADLRYNYFKGKTVTYYYYNYGTYTYTNSALSFGNLTFSGIFGDFKKSSIIKPYGILGIGLDYMSAEGTGEVYFGYEVGGGINYEIGKKSGISLNLEAKYHGNTNEGYAKGFVPINLGITYIR
ncbi:MAG: hypothetical protein NTY74_13170 [Ignavibacteriae bacterium]|nr:hypothetical protein [Ignavibacteriota bacterium]